MTRQETHPDVDLVETIQSFYRRYCEEDIAKLAQRYPTDQQSLRIDWLDLFQFDSTLADDVREQPQEMQHHFETALRQYEILAELEFEPAVRFAGLNPPHQYGVNELRTEHRNTLVEVYGQVSKRTDVEPRIVTAVFSCQRCGTSMKIPQTGTQLEEPYECSNCERQGPFEIDYEQSEFVNSQLLRVQQPPETAKGGQGSRVDVRVESDVVESAESGDRVTVAGIYEFEQKTDSNPSLTFDTYLTGHDITVEETDYDEIDVSEYRDEIVDLANSENPLDTLTQSLAPDIHGLEHIKRAITLQLFGGTKTQKPSGSSERGNFHILLIGDPGCGKSSLINAAAAIAPRATKTSGKGASKSGLTAAAVRDEFGDSEWSLEAGALVLADKGMCCVDEIDKIDAETTAALHTALESQELHINKAGINATLPARTSLLAAGNPEYGRFDSHVAIGEQIDIGPTLLSRFDLIFTLQDTPEEEKDKTIARHNIETRREANRYTYENSEPSTISPDISQDLFRAYIAYAKQECHPYVPEEIEDKLIDWYVQFRSIGEDDDSPIPITPRYIEALQRLSEASARARLADVVTEEDIDRASSLVHRFMRDAGMDPESNQFDADIVETGKPKSQRDRVKTLVGILEELESEYDEGVPHDVLMNRAEEEEMDVTKAEHELSKLKEKGEVYTPSTDCYRTT